MNQGQHKIAVRLGASRDWPFLEFWKDEIIELRGAIDRFLEPIMKEALAKREKRVKNKTGNGDQKVDEEENTLLAHLVNHTQDPKILMDELVNLLVAGRDTVS